MITAIIGCMKSSKTKLLNEMIEREILKQKEVRVFYPKCCYKEEGYITSRYGTKTKAIPIVFINDIYAHLGTNTSSTIFIDEVQFLEYGCTDVENFIDLIQCCNKYNIDLICSGLNLDFKENTFPVIEKLLSYADKIINRTGICEHCHKEANRTLRLINNTPSSPDEEVLLLENSKKNIEYKCLCVSCYNQVYV